MPTVAVAAPKGLAYGSHSGILSIFSYHASATFPVVPHTDHPRVVAEGNTDPFCDDLVDGHKFARSATSGVEFGHALGFYSERIDPPGDYYHYLLVGTPLSQNEGRAMQYAFCRSCSQFSQSGDGWDVFVGDEVETEFGASLAVGVFQTADPTGVATWRATAVEQLAVGAPLWNGNGGVHIYNRDSFTRWLDFPGSGADSDAYCDRNQVDNTLVPREKTLTGGLSTEEFGRALVVADFTCDGYDDLAVGAPGADLPAGDGTTIVDAGAVYVFRGGPLGLGSEGSLALTQGAFGTEGTPEPGDRFGEVLTVGNFNGRRVDDDPKWSCWDLAVGTPNEDEGRGEVQIFYGDSGNVAVVGPILRLGEDGMPGVRSPGDRFGGSLQGYKIGTGGHHELAIGSPGKGGGRVYLVPGSSIGLDTSATTELGQHLSAIGGGDTEGDEFGAALSALVIAGDGSLVVGAPGDSGGVGSVFVLEFSEPEPGFEVVASTALTAAQVGLSREDLTPAVAGAGTSWGSVLLAPRAFPTAPVTFD